jgi:hypothetical protein
VTWFDGNGKGYISVVSNGILMKSKKSTDVTIGDEASNEDLMRRWMRLKEPTDVTTGLEKFEEDWKERGKKFEGSELTEKKSRVWKNRFRLARLSLYKSLPRRCFTREVSNKLEEIENNFFSSIEMAEANYIKKERKISKEKWGALNGLINILKKVF